jgi:V8-like Glu-specific endopeptidase
MAISFTPGIENSNGIILDMESEHDPNVIEFDDVGHDMRRISDFKTPYTSDFNIQANELTNNVHVLSKTSPNYTIQTGTQTRIYGTALPNEIILESGAKAELINFSGKNTILIQSNSNEFLVSRSGTVVIFEGEDGTELKIPAAMSNQIIEFSNGASMDLSILNNQVMLDEQVITTTAESIHETIGDNTPPTLASITPADDATDVPVDSDLVMTFSEDVVAGTGSFVIFDGDGNVFEVVPVASATIAGDKVTLDPTADFVAGAAYFVGAQPGVVEDLAGNDFVGITDPTVFNFTITEPDPEQRYDDIFNFTDWEMSSATRLNFEPASDYSWERDAIHFDFDGSAYDDVFVISLVEDYSYNITTISFFEPYGFFGIGDSNGIMLDMESDSELNYIDIDDVGHDARSLRDFEAPYTGDYYIQAGWNPGSYFDSTGIAVYEYAPNLNDGLSFDLIEETTVNDTSGYDTSYGNIMDDLLTLPNAQAGKLEPNQVQQAYLHIEEGERREYDHDTFVLDNLDAGTKYRIKIRPDNPSNFQSNKISWLYDPSGESEDLIMNFTDGFNDGFLYSDTFTPQENGDHFLTVSMKWDAGYGEYADGPEPYDIELIEVDDGEDYGNDDSGTTYVGSDHSTYPYSAVTYIESTFPNGETYTGSGAVVGKNDVLTASHLIYSPADGGVAEDIKVYPGRDGSNIPFGSYEWDLVNYFEVDQDGDGFLDREDSEYDLAVVGFDTALGNYTGWFGLDPNAVSGNYNLTGYPGVYADWTGPRMTNDFGSVTEDSYYWVLNYNTIESNPGNSGGPLWYSENGNPYIVGVHSTGGWAVDVYSHYDEITDWIDGNDYLLDGSSEMAMAATTHEAYDDTGLEVMGVNNFQNTQLGETDVLV